MVTIRSPRSLLLGAAVALISVASTSDGFVPVSRHHGAAGGSSRPADAFVVGKPPSCSSST